MARLAAAFASSHSVMLTCELEDWLTKFRDRDDRLPFYDKLGNRIPWHEPNSQTVYFYDPFGNRLQVSENRPHH